MKSSVTGLRDLEESQSLYQKSNDIVDLTMFIFAAYHVNKDKIAIKNIDNAEL